jgi:hypothetical protein
MGTGPDDNCARCAAEARGRDSDLIKAGNSLIWDSSTSIRLIRLLRVCATSWSKLFEPVALLWDNRAPPLVWLDSSRHARGSLDEGLRAGVSS